MKKVKVGWHTASVIRDMEKLQKDQSGGPAPILYSKVNNAK